MLRPSRKTKRRIFAALSITIAEEAIKRIAQLYGVEKQARGQSPEARAALRQENAKPIFDDLEEWLRDQLPKISGKSPLAKAIRYALIGRMPKTRPYLDNGFLELDNTAAERAMKPVAIGRKNWMFAGSQRGGNSMAIAFKNSDRNRPNFSTGALKQVVASIRRPHLRQEWLVYLVGLHPGMGWRSPPAPRTASEAGALRCRRGLQNHKINRLDELLHMPKLSVIWPSSIATAFDGSVIHSFSLLKE